MFKKILKAIWCLFLEVISIPMDIIAFISVFVFARAFEKRLNIPAGEMRKAYMINIKNQYIARWNWINGDKTVWNS